MKLLEIEYSRTIKRKCGEVKVSMRGEIEGDEGYRNSRVLELKKMVNIAVQEYADEVLVPDEKGDMLRVSAGEK